MIVAEIALLVSSGKTTYIFFNIFMPIWMWEFKATQERCRLYQNIYQGRVQHQISSKVHQRLRPLPCVKNPRADFLISWNQWELWSNCRWERWMGNGLRNQPAWAVLWDITSSRGHQDDNPICRFLWVAETTNKAPSMSSTGYGIHIHELSRLCHMTVVWMSNQEATHHQNAPWY